jgi:hypothetical protein
MRFLGFLFLIVLAVAAFGYYRGWFTVTTTHAGGSTNVDIGVDTDRIRGDTAKVGELPERIAAKVRAMGKKVAADESEIEGTLVRADAAARRLVVRAGSETLELELPAGVAVERDGDPIALGDLDAGTRVRLRFRHDGDARKLASVQVLPG